MALGLAAAQAQCMGLTAYGLGLNELLVPGV